MLCFELYVCVVKETFEPPVALVCLTNREAADGVAESTGNIVALPPATTKREIPVLIVNVRIAWLNWDWESAFETGPSNRFVSMNPPATRNVTSPEKLYCVWTLNLFDRNASASVFRHC